MKKLTLLSIVSMVLILTISGCATVKVYSDAELKKETGLKYYPVRPYVLVEYQSGKDNTIKTSVVYLPDLEAPQYMVLKPGLGSSELKMSFKNGALETYGAVAESKLAESMEAFADVLSKSAYAAQTMTYTPSPEGETDNESIRPFRLYEIINKDGETVLKEVQP